MLASWLTKTEQTKRRDVRTHRESVTAGEVRDVKCLTVFVSSCMVCGDGGSLHQNSGVTLQFFSLVDTHKN